MTKRIRVAIGPKSTSVGPFGLCVETSLHKSSYPFSLIRKIANNGVFIESPVSRIHYPGMEYGHRPVHLGGCGQCHPSGESLHK